MRIVWFSWKDKDNPQAGGAETVGHELRKRLVRDGHEVTLVTASWPGAVAHSDIAGYQVVRVGNRWTVYYYAWRYYRKHLFGSTDIVIDEMNTIPFFAKFYAGCKTFLFVHQLCREVWFYEMFFPLDIIGYLLEPLYLWLLRKSWVVTVSESTKKDLVRFGFKEENIAIISEGIEWEPLQDLSAVSKFAQPTIVSIGSIRSMKRTAHIVEAYLLAKKEIKDLRLIIAGQASGGYGRKVLKLINGKGIDYRGKISEEEKRELLRKSHLYISTAVKEGWCLVVTEAGSMGTPAIGYDVDGLRDSIKDGQTGIIVKNNDVRILAASIIKFFNDKAGMEYMSDNALAYSSGINFEKGYKDIQNILNI